MLKVTSSAACCVCVCLYLLHLRLDDLLDIREREAKKYKLADGQFLKAVSGQKQHPFVCAAANWLSVLFSWWELHLDNSWQPDLDALLASCFPAKKDRLSIQTIVEALNECLANTDICPPQQ